MVITPDLQKRSGKRPLNHPEERSSTSARGGNVTYGPIPHLDTMAQEAL